jgi:hypothetical protein
MRKWNEKIVPSLLSHCLTEISLKIPAQELLAALELDYFREGLYVLVTQQG